MVLWKTKQKPLHPDPNVAHFFPFGSEMNCIKIPEAFNTNDDYV